MRQKPAPFAEAAELDRQFEAEGKRRHQEELLHSMVERYPPDAVECDIMISGIRLARFIGEWECEQCKLQTHDHTLGGLFQTWSDAYKQYHPVMVCVKDYMAKCRRLSTNIVVMDKYKSAVNSNAQNQNLGGFGD